LKQGKNKGDKGRQNEGKDSSKQRREEIISKRIDRRL
jgi:hypothetical protein